MWYRTKNQVAGRCLSIKLILIRHGKTKGNLENRYIGTTDENLCETGIQELKQIAQTDVIKKIQKENYVLYSSPLKRCVQTGNMLFPDKRIYIVPELREMDFGDFENMNYKELTGNEEYQKWIDSNGMLSFPNGESREEFINRCCKGFENVLSEVNDLQQKTDLIVMVVHGGTIMAVMDKLEQSDKSYYDYHCENGKGYICELAISDTDNKPELKIISRL